MERQRNPGFLDYVSLHPGYISTGHCVMNKLSFSPTSGGELERG
jgi:hypothetical protein